MRPVTPAPAPTPSVAPARVAVVDTDSGFTRVLVRRLADIGWEHRVVPGPVSPERLLEMRLSALVLDPRVAGEGAWDYLARLSATLPALALVVVTGPSTVAERVRGLRLGADDWVTKPCHPEEVVARVEAVLRRRRAVQAQAEAGPIVAGELEIRPDRYQAFVGGRSVDLTRREFELLRTLAAEAGRVLEREDIYQRVWGYVMARGDRSVDVFVRKLRQKLELASPGWVYIHTHLGVGYRFDPEPAGDADAEPAG